MNTTLRIAIACFVGASVGTLVALEAGDFAWPVGAIIGAVIAFLGYNIEEVISAVPEAYRSVKGWRPNRQYWSLWMKGFHEGFNFGTHVGLVFSTTVASFAMMDFQDHPHKHGTVSFSALVWLIFLLTLGLGMLSGFVEGNEHAKRVLKGERLPPPLKVRNIFIVYCLIVPGWFLKVVRDMIFGVPWLIVVMLKAAWSLICFVARFVATLFSLVHSELRLLCAVDAALGAAVGYMLGSVFVGGTAGALLGVLNYEIVSVRMLQIAGTQSVFK